MQQPSLRQHKQDIPQKKTRDPIRQAALHSSRMPVTMVPRDCPQPLPNTPDMCIAGPPQAAKWATASVEARTGTGEGKLPIGQKSRGAGAHSLLVPQHGDLAPLPGPPRRMNAVYGMECMHAAMQRGLPNHG